MNIRRWLRVSTVVTTVATLAVLAQKPFVKPYVDRAAEKAHLALDQAINGRLTPEWVGAELDAAVTANDLARTELLLGLVKQKQIPVSAAPLDRAKSYREREKALLARLKRCATCAADPAQCRTPSAFLYCSAPIEFTVIGDVRALVKAGADAVAGNPVDQIDLVLTSIGIAGTVLTPVTGGTSYSLKAGAAALRVARNMGELGTGVGRVLEEAAEIPFRWNRIGGYIRTRNLNLLTNTGRLRGVLDLAHHIQTVADHAGPINAIFLLKHLEKGTDAADLARVSTVAGKKTRVAVEVLGLARAVRAVRQLSDLFLTAIGLILALVGQLIVLASPTALRALSKAFTRAQ